MGAELGRAAHVGNWRGRALGGGGGFGDSFVGDGFADQSVAGGAGENRCRADGGEGDAGCFEFLAAVGQHDVRGDADDGDVHLVARDKALIVGAGVFLGIGDLQRDQDLAGGERILAGSGAEIFDGKRALAVGAGDIAGRRMGDQAGYGVGAGRGVAEVAAEGCPALDLDAADNRGRVDQAGIARDDLGVVVDAPAGDARADDQASARAEREFVGLGYVFDVDDVIGGEARAAQLHDQVGAAGEDAGVWALFGLEGHGFAQRARSTVFKIFQGIPSSQLRWSRTF